MGSATCPLCAEGIRAFRRHAMTIVTVFWELASQRAGSYYGDQRAAIYPMSDSMFDKLFWEDGDE